MHIPFTYSILRACVRQILELRNAHNTYKISQSWCQGFLKRHNFSQRKARQEHQSRSVAAASSDLILDYFRLLLETYDKLHLHDHPEAVWNLDEKGWSKQQAMQQPVIATKGKPQVSGNKAVSKLLLG